MSNGPTAPDTQSTVPSDTSLWDWAYETFARKNKDLDRAFREIVSTGTGSSSELLTSKRYEDKEKQLSAHVRKQVERMESREWKIRLGSKTINVWTQVERILKIALAIKDFGTQVANLDPVHAGLPVAGLYLILSVCSFDRFRRELEANRRTTVRH